MATPPTIPTSFVPKQPVRSVSRIPKTGGNLFMLIATFLLGFSLLAAAGVFAYERYLTSVAESKAQEVAQAEGRVNPDAVEDFIRTRNRFTSAKTLLEDHVAVSQFFDLLESVTLQSVRFDDLSFILAADRSAEIRMSGTARTFNALAAQSSAFATEKRIKSAIFSDIAVGQGGAVAFSLEADVDARLLALTGMPAAPASVPIAPSNDASGAATEPSALDGEPVSSPLAPEPVADDGAIPAL